MPHPHSRNVGSKDISDEYNIEAEDHWISSAARLLARRVADSDDLGSDCRRVTWDRAHEQS